MCTSILNKEKPPQQKPYFHVKEDGWFSPAIVE